jgi:hypothetical protein
MKRHITLSLQISEISNVNGGTFVCPSDFTGRSNATDTGYRFKDIFD